MLFQSATAVALLASFVAAQVNTTVNIGAIDIGTKAAWCRGQINTCGTLCSGRTSENDCVEETLVFDCLCSSNSSAPGLAFYKDTVPFYLCEQTFSDCNSQNVGNKAGQDRCAADRLKNCGKLDAKDFVAEDATAATTSSAAPSSTGNPVSSAASGAATVASTSSQQAGAMPTNMATLGSGVVAAGVAAAFGLLL